MGVQRFKINFPTICVAQVIFIDCLEIYQFTMTYHTTFETTKIQSYIWNKKRSEVSFETKSMEMEAILEFD